MLISFLGYFTWKCLFSNKERNDNMVRFSGGEGGGAWPCVQCGYAAKEEKYLIRHMRYRHSGILMVLFTLVFYLIAKTATIYKFYIIFKTDKIFCEYFSCLRTIC